MTVDLLLFLACSGAIPSPPLPSPLSIEPWHPVAVSSCIFGGRDGKGQEGRSQVSRGM